MKIIENLSDYWITLYEKDAKINLTHSTASILSYEEIFNLMGGMNCFVDSFKNKKISYGQKLGSLKLRKIISSLYGENITWESVIITNGCSNANFLAYYTFLEPTPLFMFPDD